MNFGTTLRLTLPIGTTWAMALSFLLSFWGVAEIVARTSRVHVNYPIGSLGGTDQYIAASWLALERQSLQRGQIDCIVLGSSTVRSAFNETVFESVYHKATQTHLTCNNVGIPGMVASQAGDIAQLLNEAYHPRLLILGLAARDFSVEVGAAQAGQVMDGSWIEYRIGRVFSPEGWLLDHSYAFRYFVGLCNWGDVSRPWTPPEASETVIDLTRPPDRRKERAPYDWLANYSMSQPDLAGLEQILDLQQEGVEILVIEMPVHPSYIFFFGNGQQDQQHFRATTKEMAESNGVMFWPTDPDLSLPDPLWLDRTHLSPRGGEEFSEWLALEVAEAIRQGGLVLADR
jgi:hypothetical protein